MTDFTITEDFPKSEIEFDQRFSNPEACYKFMRIVQQVVKSAKITYDSIKWDIDSLSEYFATGVF